MVVSVAAWKEKTGRTNERLAEELGVCVRSLIRYLNKERAWPFAVATKLKKISRQQLTDQSFESRAA